MTLEFQNKQIHYTDTGKGETLVLLHGFLESKEIWTNFIPEFSKYGRIITIDLPGHGKSECIEEVHTMELMAQARFCCTMGISAFIFRFCGLMVNGPVDSRYMLAPCTWHPPRLVVAYSTP